MRSNALTVARAVVALVLAAGILACKKPAPPADEAALVTDSAPRIDPMVTGAREDFAKRYSCPEDRVEVKRLSSDPGQAVPAGGLATGPPPDEVLKDPDRYAKWKADLEKDLQSARARDSDKSTFEVSGCGHVQNVACRPHHAHGAVYPDWADCSELKMGTPVGDGGWRTVR